MPCGKPPFANECSPTPPLPEKEHIGRQLAHGKPRPGRICIPSFISSARLCRVDRIHSAFPEKNLPLTRIEIPFRFRTNTRSVRNTSHRTGIQHRRRFMLRRIKSIDHIHIPSNATVHRYPARHHPDTIQPTEGAAHTDSRHPSYPSRPAAGTQPCSLRPSGLSRMACPQNQPGTIRPLLSITYADQRTPTDARRPTHPDQRTPTSAPRPDQLSPSAHLSITLLNAGPPMTPALTRVSCTPHYAHEYPPFNPHHPRRQHPATAGHSS